MTVRTGSLMAAIGAAIIVAVARAAWRKAGEENQVHMAGWWLAAMLDQDGAGATVSQS